MTAAPLPPLQQIPATIASLSDYEPYARARMTPPAWAYFSAGAADEVSLAANLRSYEAYGLWPAALASMRDAGTSVELLGHTYDYPILLAPVAYQRMAHPQGELATVLGAGAMKAGCIISMQASCRIEDIAGAAHAPLWLQWYWHPDRAFMNELLARARASGYQAIVFTVDAPVNGLRNQEQRAGFSLPPGIEAVNLRGSHQAGAVMGPAGSSPLFGSGLLDHAPGWDDLRWLVQNAGLPVLVKGVMRPHDARAAQECGAAGIIVSNHGGRTLDGAPAPLQVLKSVVQAVDVPVLMDGGIRRGTDVLKALALGARAVLIGRPYIYGLAAAGAAGVAHVLHLLRAELEVAMALTGCPSLASIHEGILFRPGREP